MSRAWREAIDARFAGREELSKDDLKSQFWRELPEAEVLDALRAIETECEVRIGLMRPSDAMATLFEPPRTKNPFRWMEYQVHGGDTDFELSRQLNNRLKKTGHVNDWRRGVRTLDDFVRAWAGVPPPATATDQQK